MKPELKLNTEYPAPDEQETTEKLIVLLKRVIEGRYLTGLTYRDVHVKGHAGVRAEFIVEPNLPEELRVGVFKEPRTYPAWIRFSNSSETPSPDIKKDIRGFALKLMDVEGEKLLASQKDATTQDFIFLTTNLFLTKDAKDFLKLVETGALNQEKSFSDYVAIFWYFLTRPKVGASLRAAQRKFPHLLELEWFSATPYLFGERAVKYALKPWLKTKSELPQDPTNNFLRERLAEHLAREGTGFDFMVQFQLDPYREPIENSLVEWKEENTPFIKLASINIPRQIIDAPEQMVFTENLSFNPWHCLPEHRPLGSANRVRQAVYQAISEFRRSRNGVPIAEPTPDENFGMPPGAPNGSEATSSGVRIASPPPHPEMRGSNNMFKKFANWLKGLETWQKLLAGVLALLLVVGLPYLIYSRYARGLADPEKPTTDTLHLNNDVWTEAERQRYYHLSQGSEIMPYDWFIALEQGNNERPFISDDNMTRFRLIPDPNAISNPDRLPIGFAKDERGDPVTGMVNVGLTCAGCHTAQMTYKGTGIRIDGAPGKVDFDGFIASLVGSLSVTAASPTLVPDSKFNRFARKVLKEGYSVEKAARLKIDVVKFLAGQLKSADQQKRIDAASGKKATKGGFGRIDALGAGGNRLYGQIDPKNLRTLDSPVKALPLWYTHQYNWVQTNGSIRQPMARNIIEALAVNASLVFPGDPAKNDRYTSSVRLDNMAELEGIVSRFKAPIWPEKVLGALNQDRIKRGATLYQTHCASCHAPQMESQPEPSDPVSVRHNKTYFVLPLTPVDKTGTDPLDAVNFADRTLDASSIKDDAGKQMSKDTPGPVVIGMVLSGIINRRYKEISLPQEKQDEWNGFRDNLLRACKSYPARPLAGVWATAPYLHNGSVHSLYQLLLPENDRDRKFYTGSVEFDPVNVGFDTTQIHGAFEFDTSIPGNSNRGHQYGVSMTHEERLDLIEFLKDLKFSETDFPKVAPSSPTDCGS